MKILYGVQGTGNGHLTRARLMQKAFAAKDVEIDWIFSGREPTQYFDMQPFGDYRTFTGLTFAVNKGRINYPKTLWQSDLAGLWRDIKALDVAKYDLVINDFEPISAWAAKRAGVPSIGISHQCAFQYGVPRRAVNVGVRAFMRHFAPVDTGIGLHWHHFEQPILPPLVDVQPRAAPLKDAPILVYLPFSAASEVLPVLQRHKDYQFEVYLAKSAPLLDGNVRVHGFSRAGFAAHLALCAGVICSAGFELPGEALQLGKRLMVMPVAGQAEQEANAEALALLGRACVIKDLADAPLKSWLAEAPPAPAGYPDVAAALAAWIAGGRQEPVASLIARLWQR